MARVLVLAARRNDLSPKIRVIRGLPRCSLGGDSTASTLQRFPNSPRNTGSNFAQYISERPEMTSHDEEPKEARTTERKLNHE